MIITTGTAIKRHQVAQIGNQDPQARTKVICTRSIEMKTKTINGTEIFQTQINTVNNMPLYYVQNRIHFK